MAAELLLAFIKPISDMLMKVFGSMRRVRVTVHRAYFFGGANECLFVNVTNLSRSDVEITHVWFDFSSGQVALNQPSRTLPKRLKPDESWETWIYRSILPTPRKGDLLTRARVRLSTGEILKSRPNQGVPHTGSIPGGPIGRSTHSTTIAACKHDDRQSFQ
jgi:hypothetical protein